jgi:hypothetical protein
MSTSAAYCFASCKRTAQPRVSKHCRSSACARVCERVLVWHAASAHCRHPCCLSMVCNRLVGRNRRHRRFAFRWTHALHLPSVPAHQVLVRLRALVKNHLVVTELLRFNRRKHETLSFTATSGEHAESLAAEHRQVSTCALHGSPWQWLGSSHRQETPASAAAYTLRKGSSLFGSMFFERKSMCSATMAVWRSEPSSKASW